MTTPPSKQKVLADIGTLVQSGNLTLKELEDVYSYNVPEGAKPEAPGANISKPSAKSNNLATALYVVGTLIVCVGIYLLIAQNWNQMNAPVRIAVTLGLGLLLFGAATGRAKRGIDPNADLLTASLFTIASTALGIGAGVAVTEAGASLSAAGTLTATAFVVTAAFAASYFVLVRSLVVLLFGIAAAVVAYYAGIDWVTASTTDKGLVFYAAQTITAGLLLIVGGQIAQPRALARRIAALLYELGTFLILSAGFWLTATSGFSDGSSSDVLYNILYPVLLAGGVWLSVYVKLRSILILTALFLTCYIFEISFRYFSDVLGGSIALCLAGVLVMGMAYGATRFAKRFISRS